MAEHFHDSGLEGELPDDDLNLHWQIRKEGELRTFVFKFGLLAAATCLLGSRHPGSARFVGTNKNRRIREMVES